MVYSILDALPDRTVLDEQPSQCWAIISLEIVVQVKQVPYALLTHVSYPLGNASDPLRGLWAFPFRAEHLQYGYSLPERVGEINELFQSYEKATPLPKAVDELAYLLGLSAPKFRSTGVITELKTSPRSPNQVKCYRIYRFQLVECGPLSLRNLADPEVRKGHVFFPLTTLTKCTNQSPLGDSRFTQFEFLGKPLLSNVCRVIDSPEKVAALSASAIELEPNLFRHDCSGVLLFGDLLGYGKACKYAVEEMHSFEQVGEAINDGFTTNVTELLYRFFISTGISQAHCAGDGFLAALPCREDDVERELGKIVKEYMDIVAAVDEMNEAIKDPASKIGSRLVIHYGKYSYGRIAGPLSFSADFNGHEIIAAARMDDGLRAFVKSEATSEDDRVLHWCAVSSSDGLKGLKDLDGWTKVGLLSCEVKESQVNMTVFNTPTRTSKTR